MIFFADTPQKVDNIFQSIKQYVLHILAFILFSYFVFK